MSTIGVIVGTVTALMSGLVILVSVILLIIASVKSQPKKPMLISGLSGIGVLIVSFTVMAVCVAIDSSISKEEYDSLSEVYRKTSSELEEIKSENIKLSRDYDELQKEYDEFKSKAEPFMKLSEEEQAAEIARAGIMKVTAANMTGAWAGKATADMPAGKDGKTSLGGCGLRAAPGVGKTGTITPPAISCQKMRSRKSWTMKPLKNGWTTWRMRTAARGHTGPLSKPSS